MNRWRTLVQRTDTVVRARIGGLPPVASPVARGKDLLKARRVDGGTAMKIVGRVIGLVGTGGEPERGQQDGAAQPATGHGELPRAVE